MKHRYPEMHETYAYIKFKERKSNLNICLNTMFPHRIMIPPFTATEEAAQHVMTIFLLPL